MYLFSLLGVLILFLIIPVYAQESNTIRLIPTDDTFLLVDYSDPDEFKNLQEKPLGDLDVMTSWYTWDFAPEKKVMGTTFLKFDLKDIARNQINSAKLFLYAEKTKIVENSPNLAIYSFDDTSWSEKDFVYYDSLVISEKISDTIMVTNPGLYAWDITQYVIDNAGSEISFAVIFDRIITGSVERVTFVSKDSPLGNRPTLVIETSSEKQNITESSSEDIPQAKADEIVELEKRLDLLNKKLAEIIHSDSNIVTMIPTDDAYVTANLNDPDDSANLREQNTGDLPFLRTWYAWNVTKNQEQIITIPHLKFDLGDIESDKVISANLKLTPLVIKNVLDVAPELELGLQDNDWNESEITYLNTPENSMNDLITSVMIDNTWYSWDITDLVKENAGSSLSVVFSFKNLYDNTEELITFHSKETEDPENLPVLKIQYAAAIPPILSSLQENETDYTLAAIVGVLVAVTGIAIFIALILRKKRSKQLPNEKVSFN